MENEDTINKNIGAISSKAKIIPNTPAIVINILAKVDGLRNQKEAILQTSIRLTRIRLVSLLYRKANVISLYLYS